MILNILNSYYTKSQVLFSSQILWCQSDYERVKLFKKCIYFRASCNDYPLPLCFRHIYESLSEVSKIWVSLLSAKILCYHWTDYPSHFFLCYHLGFISMKTRYFLISCYSRSLIISKVTLVLPSFHSLPWIWAF